MAIDDKTLIERAQYGKKLRVKDGIGTFAARVPYGYRRVDGEQLLAIDEDTAKWVRLIFDMRLNARKGYMQIARELNKLGAPTPAGGGEWRNETVRYILKNVYYKGLVRYGNVETQGKHEPLISPADWAKAQVVSRAGENASKTGAMRGHLALSGLMVCGFCGYSMTAAVIGKSKIRGWRCSRYARSGGKECTHNWNNNEEVEEYVMEAVMHSLRNPELFILAREHEAERDRLAARVEELDLAINDNKQRLTRLLQALEKGALMPDELIVRRKRLDAELADLQKRRTALYDESMVHAAAVEIIRETAPLVSKLPSMTPTELQSIYRKLIKHIRVKKGETPVIEWL